MGRIWFVFKLLVNAFLNLNNLVWIYPLEIRNDLKSNYLAAICNSYKFKELKNWWPKSGSHCLLPFCLAWPRRRYFLDGNYNSGRCSHPKPLSSQICRDDLTPLSPVSNSMAFALEALLIMTAVMAFHAAQTLSEQVQVVAIVL